jgi:heme/copper-type cytochrome/quinol oxidase subunit 2
MENNFGYNRHKYFADYIKEEPKKKKESEPIEVTPWIVAAIFTIVAVIMGFFIYRYLQQLKLEESPLKVGQVWEEEIIRIPEFRVDRETIYVKNKIIDLTPTRVTYIHGGEDTLVSDHLSFMTDSRKLR